MAFGLGDRSGPFEVKYVAGFRLSNGRVVFVLTLGLRMSCKKGVNRFDFIIDLLRCKFSYAVYPSLNISGITVRIEQKKITNCK